MAINYSYHEIIRRTSAAFGTLFNNIYIRHPNEDGDDYSFIKVPLAYGPIQKFLARIEQKPDLRNRVAITLPRMSYQIGQLSYDSSRKVSSTQTFKTGVGELNTPANLYLPSPWNLPFELSIATKNNDDMFQIVEQILPIFKPEYNLSVNLVSTIGDIKKVPIILQSVSPFQDEYDGYYDTRRFIQCTLNFNAKIYLYGAIPSDDDKKIIKKVQIDYYSDVKMESASRQVRYIATPKATKDYDNDEVTSLSQNIDELITSFSVSNSLLLNENSYIQINDEVMYIKSIEDGIITVRRGEYATPVTDHQEGSNINSIDGFDDELIQFGDEFDFNEETFNFGDGKIYSPRKGVDV